MGLKDLIDLRLNGTHRQTRNKTTMKIVGQLRYPFMEKEIEFCKGGIDVWILGLGIIGLYFPPPPVQSTSTLSSLPFPGFISSSRIILHSVSSVSLTGNENTRVTNNFSIRSLHNCF